MATEGRSFAKGTGTVSGTAVSGESAAKGEGNDGNDIDGSELMLECLGCGAFVTESYVRVFAGDEPGPRVRSEPRHRSVVSRRCIP